MLKWKRAGMVGLYGMPLMTLMALGGGDFYLPGSQPNPGAYHFQSTELCSYCHGDSQYAYNPDTGEGPDPNFTTDHEPHFQWMGGMMAQAAPHPPATPTRLPAPRRLLARDALRGATDRASRPTPAQS